MCGLAGILRAGIQPTARLADDIARMTATLVHRGPDDEGYWSDADAGVALGFRRLAIVDLSPAGHQPMVSRSEGFVCVFNGEIYNHVELRRELEAGGARFRGGSDTEVLLESVERWGVEGAVRRFVGMFAIALWDRRARALHLVRDRLGIKPMFVHWRAGEFLFASELKAILALPHVSREVDRDALTAYFRYLCVPAPGTILRDCRKLLPGHILTLSDPSVPPPASRPYWSLEEVAESAGRSRRAWTDAEMVAEGERILSDAVALRMRADVPVGAFLSGGIDSSLVTALMQSVSPRPVKTFTIGFEADDYDESVHAARVASHLGTDHTSVRLSGGDALSMVPGLPQTFDEPLADPSQIPTWLVSGIAREQVTVALSGDGGDELLAGYNRYTHGERILARAARLPAPLRAAAARAVTSVSTRGWDRAYRGVAPLLPPGARQRLPGEKLHKVAALLSRSGFPEMYRSLLSAWQEPLELVIGGSEPPERTPHLHLSALERMMLADQLHYLPDDLLAKVDRASMAVALEVRVPILDHRFVEYTWRLPRAARIRGSTGKWLLREMLRRHVPDSLTVRPKMGFSVPIAAWLRGPLRDWAGDMLAEESLRRGGLIRPAPVTEAWRALGRGNDSTANRLWAVLMFQAWHAHWLEPRSATVTAARSTHPRAALTAR